jgi:N-acetylneuraminate synthase
MIPSKDTLVTEFKIGNRILNEDSDPLIIAEIGINHGGSLKEAIKIAESAIKSGAEIIKHQTHVIEDEMSNEAKNVIPGNSNKSIYEIISECALSESDEFKLRDFVISKGVIFISTPFSRLAVKRIKKMNLPAVKIGSGECSNLPLLSEILKLEIPIIMSTGMHTIESIRPSVELIRRSKIPFALLHCTNLYPTPANLVRLGSINELKAAFPDAIIGLSDHSESNYPAFAALGLGAKIVERHFTDSKNRLGPDIPCSMDPLELTELIKGSKIINQTLKGGKFLINEESVTRAFALSSVVAIREILIGEELTWDNIWVMRPSGGDFSANEIYNLIGKKAKVNIMPGFQIKFGDISF